MRGGICIVSVLMIFPLLSQGQLEDITAVEMFVCGPLSSVTSQGTVTVLQPLLVSITYPCTVSELVLSGPSPSGASLANLTGAVVLSSISISGGAAANLTFILQGTSVGCSTTSSVVASGLRNGFPVNLSPQRIVQAVEPLVFPSGIIVSGPASGLILVWDCSCVASTSPSVSGTNRTVAVDFSQAILDSSSIEISRSLIAAWGGKDANSIVIGMYLTSSVRTQIALTSVLILAMNGSSFVASLVVWNGLNINFQCVGCVLRATQSDSGVAATIIGASFRSIITSSVVVCSDSCLITAQLDGGTIDPQPVVQYTYSVTALELVDAVSSVFLVAMTELSASGNGTNGTMASMVINAVVLSNLTAFTNVTLCLVDATAAAQQLNMSQVTAISVSELSMSSTVRVNQSTISSTIVSTSDTVAGGLSVAGGGSLASIQLLTSVFETVVLDGTSLNVAFGLAALSDSSALVGGAWLSYGINVSVSCDDSVDVCAALVLSGLGSNASVYVLSSTLDATLAALVFGDDVIPPSVMMYFGEVALSAPQVQGNFVASAAQGGELAVRCSAISPLSDATPVACGTCMPQFDCNGGTTVGEIHATITTSTQPGAPCRCDCHTNILVNFMCLVQDLQRVTLAPLTPRSRTASPTATGSRIVSPSGTVTNISRTPWSSVTVTALSTRTSKRSTTLSRTVTPTESPLVSGSGTRTILVVTQTLTLTKNPPATATKTSTLPYVQPRVTGLTLAFEALGAPSIISGAVDGLMAGISFLCGFLFVTQSTKGPNVSRLASLDECSYTAGWLRPPRVSVWFYLPVGQPSDDLRYLKGAILSCIVFAVTPQILVVALLHRFPYHVRTRIVLGLLSVMLWAYFLPGAVTPAVLIFFYASTLSESILAVFGLLAALIALILPIAALTRMPSICLAFRMYDRGARSYEDPFSRFYVFEDVGVAMLLSAIIGFAPGLSNGCVGVGVAATAICVAHMVYLAWVWPCSRKLVNVCNIITAGVQTAVSAASLGSAIDTRILSTVAELAILQVVNMGAQMLLFLAWYAFRIHLRRRLYGIAQVNTTPSLFESELRLTQMVYGDGGDSSDNAQHFQLRSSVLRDHREESGAQERAFKFAVESPPIGVTSSSGVPRAAVVCSLANYLRYDTYGHGTSLTEIAHQYKLGQPDPTTLELLASKASTLESSVRGASHLPLPPTPPPQRSNPLAMGRRSPVQTNSPPRPKRVEENVPVPSARRAPSKALRGFAPPPDDDEELAVL